MVRGSEFKSEDPGFDLVGQGEGQFFCPSDSTHADLRVPDPPSCLRHAPKFVRMLKIAYPSVSSSY